MAYLVRVEALDRQKMLLPIRHTASLQEGGGASTLDWQPAA